ncbi:testis specific tektin [Bombyx mori]|uniref:Tektin n=1 Tax=Bombyx mori TaxID=7091 RepID=Q9BLD7_BOMMO|nr:testis specific tektin [Bombyx mori]BAB33388.1 testis specific tektin [Bombyx mori]
MTTEDPSKTCPYICPTTIKPAGETISYLEAGMSRGPENPHASPYVPGLIQPPEKKIYPPGAPPRYLPQPTDSTSGDILGMGPIGPWAPGHIDWTPHAGTTGVRPVVDKYSITRYSTGEWRKNNEYVLTPRATDKARNWETTTKKDLANAFSGMDNKLADVNNKLEKRVKDLSHWKREVEKAVLAITDEINVLDQDRGRLKGACRILMLPEAISRECLELRTNRYEPDLVRDDAEQELIKEVAIVGEIRRVFMDTLAKVEEQMSMNKAAKASIEFDWSDKMVSLKLDTQNLKLSPDSNLLLWHPGVARWPENATTLEYWEHFCCESIRNCEEVRQKSKNLRGDLMTAIVKGSQDMKIQAERTNAALAETVSATEELCEKLEETLKINLQQLAHIENLIDELKDSLRKVDERNKLVMTRLHARNYDRPNVENCRDEAQYALMAEAKFVRETCESLSGKLREAEIIRSDLMKYRGELEKQIACKRKSLNIDLDRCARVRAHMPTPEEFAAG